MNRIKTLAIVLGMFSATNAFAEFTFSNVSATANSVTFTINGNMNGYAQPVSSSYNDQFSIQYSGPRFQNIFDYTPNTWSESVFDNETISMNGNTGNFGSSVPYSWSEYTTSLSNATATNRTITLTTQNGFGSSGPGLLTFVWGNGNTGYDTPTVLGTAQVSAVPESGTLAMLAGGMALIAVAFRKKFDRS